MAPKPLTDEKPKNPKCRLVHFNGNRMPTVGSPKGSVSTKMDNQRGNVSNSSSFIKAPENYENLLLFYLTKLKNLFSTAHPQPTARQNSTMKINKHHHDHNLRNPQLRSVSHPCKYTSSNPPRSREEDIKSNVYRVVSAALEYGFANNVLEKKGDYFALRNNRARIATRQATPGPSRYCEKCCNMHKYLKGPSEGNSCRFSERHKTMQRISEKPMHSIQHGKIEKGCRVQSASGHYSQPYHCGEAKLKANILHCPECRALERKLNPRM